MVSTVILTESNLKQIPNTFNAATDPAPYNKLYLPIINGVSLKDRQIALQKCSLYFAWPNISSTNNTFTFDWPNGAGFTTSTITIPASTNIGSIAELNDFLQFYMISQKYYLVDTNGLNVYYAEFISNPNYYGVSLNLYILPTSLPAGWTDPGTTYGSTAKTPKVTILATNDFSKLIGLSAAVYDGTTANKSYVSDFTPQLSPVSSVQILLNIADNSMSLNNSSTVISTFTTRGVSYGSLIEVESSELIWFNCNTNLSSTIEVSLVDQNFVPLNLQDPQITTLLLIK